MKKVILGSAMFLAGVLSVANILAGSLANELMVNDQRSAMLIIQRYGLTPSVYFMGGIALVGLALAIWGLIEKKA